MTTAAAPQKTWSIRDVALFLILTFGITCSIGATAVFAPDWFLARFGPFNGSSPMFYLAVWAPNIAAIVVVLFTRGWSGLADLASRLFRWPG